MAKELTDEERKKIREEKVRKVSVYQQKLDVFCGPSGKVSKWDKDVEKKGDTAKRLWNEGKKMIEIYRQKAQTEIDLIHGFPEESWENRTDNFRRDYARLVKAYNSAVAKIRYEKPTDHFKQLPFTRD